MNPTRKFINELIDLLAAHEETTGTYIEIIKIQRIDVTEKGDIRPEKLINRIDFEIV